MWGILFLPPALLLRHVWRGAGSVGQTAVLPWSAIYLLLAVLLAVFVAFGLWLPFSAA